MSQRKATVLRRVKRMKRVAELVSRMRQREYRRTILDPVEYDAQPVIRSGAHPSVLRMLRRQG